MANDKPRALPPGVDFQPVLLGSDDNVYGMARAFHEAYRKRSVAFGRGSLPATMHSRIVTVHTVPALEDGEVFVGTLVDYATQFTMANPNTRLLLVPCGDNFIKLLVRNRDRLSQFYCFTCISQELLDMLQLKEDFYAACDKYGFDYPQTATVTRGSYAAFTPPFGYPVVIKPSNSVMYWNCNFTHKKKVFVANNSEEYKAITDAIYTAEYTDTLIIQEFIPGDDSRVRVLNAYCGRDGRVALMSMGRVLLEVHSPQGIGSYGAIISGFSDPIITKIKQFLEEIGYVGMANFDMKFDARDGKFKLFEINLRAGRSSYFVTAAGDNLAEYFVRDALLGESLRFRVAEGHVLWRIIPRGIIRKYIADKNVLAEANALMKSGADVNSLFYRRDMSPARFVEMMKEMYRYRRKYKTFFNNRGLR